MPENKSSPLSSFASAGADIAVQYGLQNLMNKKQQEFYKENQQRNFDLSQQAQRNSSQNVVAGLKMAGLSPALASSGSFSPASMPGAPLGSSEVPKSSFLESMAIGSQINLQNAEARKTDAEAEEKETEVRRMANEDETIALNMKQYFTQLAKDAPSVELQKFYTDMAGVAADKGSMSGLSSYFDLQGKTYKVRADIIADKVRSYVEDFRLGQVRQEDLKNPLFASLVRMPEKQFEKVVAEIGYLGAMSDYYSTMKELGESERKLTDEEIEQIKAVTDHIRNTDIKQLIDKGDYKGAAIAFFCLIAEAFAGGSSRLLPTRSTTTKK